MLTKKEINYALLKTHVMNNNIEKVKKQINSYDPRIDNNYLIQTASQSGFFEICKILLSNPKVDPSSLKNTSIILAASNGHFKVVELLVKDKRVDPTESLNDAIYFADQERYHDITKLLFEINAVRKSLIKDEPELFHRLNNNYIQKKIDSFV
jgi:ankyrin repeat protein